jgi:NAD(P)-dependent dehydrogenase (short-subunit alcohol dehydrogenase family)
MDLKGKIAMVTGGTRGIGRAIAERLLREEASVAICGLAQEQVDLAVQEMAERPGGKIIGRAADVSSSEDVASLFHFVDSQWGGLDILVNNAGTWANRSVADLSIEEWRQTIGTNLTGVFLCSREAIPRMCIRQGGFIINISSLAGKNAFRGGAAYNASKFGVNGFSEAMMLDHRYDNIKVCYIMPGSVDTDFGQSKSGGSWKIPPGDVAEVVATVLKMREQTLISRVEMRPLKPEK